MFADSQSQPSRAMKSTPDLMGNLKWRTLSGYPLYVQNVLLLAITLLCASWSIDLHHIVGLPVFKEQFLALIFALAMAAIFIGLKRDFRVVNMK